MSCSLQQCGAPHDYDLGMYPSLRYTIKKCGCWTYLDGPMVITYGEPSRVYVDTKTWVILLQQMTDGLMERPSG